MLTRLVLFLSVVAIFCIVESIGSQVEQNSGNAVQVPSKIILPDDTTADSSNRQIRQANEGSYFLSPFPLAWYDAKNYCESAGMKLLSIETDQENYQILGLMSSAGVQIVWTSGTDVGTDGWYYWYSLGIYFGYTNWITTTPTDPVRNCVFIGTNEFWAVNGGFQKSGWYVADCSAALRFVCE